MLCCREWHHCMSSAFLKRSDNIYSLFPVAVLMYGTETWVLGEADELRLGVFERKVLRRIYGLIC